MSKISYASWDGTQVVITTTTGATVKCKNSNFTANGYQVVGCNVVGDEVHVLVKRGMSLKAEKYHIVSKYGNYKTFRNL